jgi:hypothetical protein
MPFWEGLLKGGAEGLLKPIAEIVDSVVTNKEERIKVETELKRVILDHEVIMQQEWTKREAQLINDVANARAMNMKSMDNNDKFIRRFPYYLAAGVLLAIFGLFLFIINGEVTLHNKEIVFTILGSLTGASISILSFFFGTTRGAESKNETIKNLSASTNGN